MLVHIFGAKCIGIDAVRVTVEVDIASGIGIHLCGLGDVAVKESLLRTVTALQSLGYHIPGRKIVINLAPADLHKSGSGYDLPIAIGIIAASGQRDLPLIKDTLIMGELGLDGSVRPIKGGLPMADFAKKTGFRRCILPISSALEASRIQGIDIYGVRNLTEVIDILSGSVFSTITETPPTAESADESAGAERVDFADIIGQEGAKRALEIAACGAHNLIMIGSPGSGKSSLAKALPGILPPLTDSESLLCSKIYSVAGISAPGGSLMRTRPFRSPHYSASLAAIIGGTGGTDNIIPGEVTLSHLGVLFLDEFNLMPRSVIEALRAPLEDRKVVISRLRSKIEYPASFTLIAAANPCPCGYYGEQGRCTCTPGQRNQYLSRLSGPIMDRMDLQVWVHPLNISSLKSTAPRESSAQIARRVLLGRRMQTRRFEGTGISSNAEMSVKQIGRFCPLEPDCEKLLSDLMETMQFSMRAYYRIIKVARSIADLEGSENIRKEHIMEASGYRFLDRATE